MNKNSLFNPFSVDLGALGSMLNRNVMHLAVLICCLFFWGCSHRFDRFGFFRPKHDKKATTTKSLDNHEFLLRLVATSFDHDKSVLNEDAANFSTFFLEQLVQDGNFAVELRPDAVQEFSSLANQANPDILRDLGKKYKVEALVRGRVKEYSYKLGRREFSISLNLEIEGINTHNSVRFFHLDKKFQQRFRLRGRRQRDMSSYNLRFLNEVIQGIRESFNEQFKPIVIAQKSRHGGSIPTRALADDLGPGPFSREQLMHMYLWPVSNSGQEKIGPQPLIVKSSTSQMAKSKTQQNEQIRKALTKSKPKKANKLETFDPEELMLRSAQEAEQRLTMDSLVSDSSKKKLKKEAIFTPKIEVSPARPVGQDLSLELNMLGFQLVYPERLQGEKQYQKLYYLLKDHTKQVSALDLESAGEEVLELEIFTTYDRTAVKKFLEDYFHGSYPSPRGKIPAVFERYYLGKLQLGFVLGNQAFIVSTHRNNREILDNAVQRFYVNNGGVTVARILDTSIKNRRLDNIVIEKEQRTDYLPKRSADKRNQNINPPPSKNFSENQVEISDTDLDIQSEENEVVSEYSINQPEMISSKLKRVVRNPEALEYEDGIARNPYEVSNELVSEDIATREGSQFNGRGDSIRSKLPQQIVKSSSEDFSENGLDQVEVSSNAAFYYDIGRRYFISSQYELSKRYMNLAFENGYRSDELNKYLSEIEKRLNPNSENSRSLVKSIQNESRKIDQRALPRYQYDLEKTGPAVESGALEFDTSNKKRSLSLGTENQRNRALEEFYSEMEKMEAELRQYTKKKRQLSTSANGHYKNPSLADLAFQILAIVALVLFFLSFLSTRRIPASPVSTDLSRNTNKNS